MWDLRRVPLLSSASISSSISEVGMVEVSVGVDAHLKCQTLEGWGGAGGS